MSWLAALLASISLAAQSSPAPASKLDDPFKLLAFLIGDWTGAGGGGPGQGSGEFSFHFDLGRKILVRRNSSEYPAQAGRAAYRHDDLMIVYREGNTLRAVYFDSEGHVIAYAVEASAESARFISTPVADQPGYRLTYRKTGEARVDLEFEIAPPGKPDAFASYITATVRRKDGR